MSLDARLSDQQTLAHLHEKHKSKEMRKTTQENIM
jgi:hypothetical protein